MPDLPTLHLRPDNQIGSEALIDFGDKVALITSMHNRFAYTEVTDARCDIRGGIQMIAAPRASERQLAVS